MEESASNRSPHNPPLLRICRRWLLLLLLPGLVAQADYPLEFIELSGRSAAEVIPIIQPFVGTDGAVTGMGNQLIIRAAPRRLSEIRRILQKIDHPPRRLTIYVRQGKSSRQQRKYLGAGVNIGTDHGAITAGHPLAEDSVSIALSDGANRNRLMADQRVQTLEGSPAYIAIGREFPVPYDHRGISGDGGRHYRGIGYRQAVRGFYVVPRLNGEQVTLEIRMRAEGGAGPAGSVDRQSIATQVTGRLGHWIALGGVDEQFDGETSGLLEREDYRAQTEFDVFVLVEEIP